MNGIKKVLVCDDEESIREALKTFLIMEGYEVTQAEDGLKGLEEFKKENFDIVFMDVKMPGIDGVECMREMKKLKPAIKVVIITGLADETTFDRAVSVSENAAEGFIAKPFKPDDLKRVLKNIAAGKTVSSFQLTPSQIAVLNRLAEVGAENASVAFTQAVKKETLLSVEKIRIVPFSRILKNEDREDENAAMLVKFTGDISGGILVMFSWQDGLRLINLMGKKPDGTTSDFDQAGQQLLKAAGNMLAVSYLNAVKSYINAQVQPEMAELIFDKRNNILKSAGKNFALSEPLRTDEYIFSVENELSIAGADITGHILFIPDADSVKTILKTSGAMG